MKRTVKRVLHSLAPRWATALLSARARAHGHRVVEQWGCLDLNDNLVILERLRGSHAVHAVGSGADRRSSSREFGFISEKERRLANQEVRDPQTWLLCLPKDGPNASLQARAAALFHPAPALPTRGEREA